MTRLRCAFDEYEWLEPPPLTRATLALWSLSLGFAAGAFVGWVLHAVVMHP